MEGELKPEDIRPGEPDTRIKDVEKAHVMAEAGNNERQLLSIADKLRSKKISYEEAYPEIIKLEPSLREGTLQPYGQGNRLDGADEEHADVTEYWAGFIHDQKLEGLKPQDVISAEGLLKHYEEQRSYYLKFANDLPDLVKKRYKFELLHDDRRLGEFSGYGKETSGLFTEYYAKLSELLNDPNTKVDDLIVLKQKLIESCVQSIEVKIIKLEIFLESVKNGTYKKGDSKGF